MTMLSNMTALSKMADVRKDPSMPTPPLDLRGRRALVTGAGSGIGRALALELAARGGAIALAGRRAEPLNETAALVAGRGGSAHVITADLTLDGEPERVVEAAV